MLRVSGMPPGCLIVGVRVVLGVLLPVLRRGVVPLICAKSPPRDIVSAGRGSFSKDVLCRMTDIQARAQAHEASGIVRGHHE